jgi:hypothetical protein
MGVWFSEDTLVPWNLCVIQPTYRRRLLIQNIAGVGKTVLAFVCPYSDCDRTLIILDPDQRLWIILQPSQKPRMLGWLAFI